MAEFLRPFYGALNNISLMAEFLRPFLTASRKYMVYGRVFKAVLWGF
jgi:hypothetical protein